MRAISVMQFVVLGAIGFGVGGAIFGLLIMFLPGGVALLLWLLVGGAVGGALLGLVTKDRKRVALLAVLGALGLTLGVFATLTFGSFFNYSSALMGALVGAVLGASLGAAFWDWRTILALAVAGAAGFGVGLLAGDLLRASFPMIRGAGSIAISGVIGGASLGAALGFLENRSLAEERELRVR